MIREYLMLAPGLFRETGGVERYGQTVLRALADSSGRARCTALILNDAGMSDVSPFGEGVMLIGCARTEYRFVWKLIFVARAILQLLGRRPHLVICGHVHFAPLCLLLKILFRLDYVVVTYGIEAWTLKGRMVRRGLEVAFRILSISRYTRRRLLEQVPALEEKVELLPNAVDPDVFFPAPKPPELIARYGLEGKKVLLTVGRLEFSEDRKGYKLVLDAVANVARVRRDIRYLVVGKGRYLRHLALYAEAIGLRETVVFTGFVSEIALPDYYNCCDVFVMPSKKEGFGFVFLEALACGKPVIAGNQGGSTDALLDGRLGLLVDPDSVEEVADAIVRVLDKKVDPQLLNAGFLRRTVVEHYGYERFRERLHQVLDRGLA